MRAEREFFVQATAGELGELFTLVDSIPSDWLFSIIQWTEGECRLYGLEYESGARWLIETLKKQN